MRTVPFQQFHQTVDAELRVTPHEQMHMIGQDLPLNEFLPPAFDLLRQDNLQTFIYGWRQHLTSVFWTKDDMIPTDRDDVAVASCFIPHVHANTLSQ